MYSNSILKTFFEILQNNKQRSKHLHSIGIEGELYTIIFIDRNLHNCKLYLFNKVLQKISNTKYVQVDKIKKVRNIRKLGKSLQ